jgi:hypothetical protein
MEDVGTFYGRLVHFTVFCYILLTFGKVRGNVAYFIPFWYFCTKKNLATLLWQTAVRPKLLPRRQNFSARFD